LRHDLSTDRVAAAAVPGIYREQSRFHRTRASRPMSKGASTHIMMYEDGKLSNKDIYIAYSDLKGTFGGMDHRILFQLMKEY
jgi:hypothetical protein